jgi:ubiquinone/menaquinone biosynthesis C-methylase UbiE
VYKQCNFFAQDHSEPVLRSHRQRTAANSAPYLLGSGHIKPDSHILDIGCGPGTISVDFAALAPNGRVVGIDTGSDVLGKAQELARARNLANITFQVGDIHALDFPDATFDVVHVHQVLQHVRDPVKALRETMRVTKPGGVVAARESDFETLTMFPDENGAIARWKSMHIAVGLAHGAQPNAGRRLISWAKQAGAKNVKASASVWGYSTPEERSWWAGMWCDRLVTSFKNAALPTGLTTEPELQKIVEAVRIWEKANDGWMSLSHCDILCFA